MNSGESVLKEILGAVESGGDASVVFAKYVKRYPKDIELLKASELFSIFLNSRDDKDLSEVKSRLKKLIVSRGLELSGGGDIGLKDRRKSSASLGAQERK